MSIEYYKPLNKSYISNINQDGDVALKPIKAKLKIRLNGICEINIALPYDTDGRWKIIEDGGVIKSPTPYSDGQLFAIYNTKRKTTGLEIKAYHIFFDLAKSTVDDKRVVNKSCKEALDALLEGTLYKGKSNISKLSTCYFIDDNRVAFINGNKDNSILKRWGGEIFLDNYNIIIDDKIGNDYGVEINYGVSLQDIGLTADETSIVTRGKPKAFNGRKLPEIHVDSPLVDKYRIIYEDFIDMDDLKLKEDTQDGDGFDTEEELYEAMRNRMKELYDGGLDKPTVSGDVKVAPLENTEKYKYVKGLVNIGLGDVVHINYKNIGTDIQSRCIGYDWDILTKKYDNVIIGDEIKNYFNSTSDVSNKVNNIIASNGSVKADSIEGIINGVKTQMKACRDLAQPVPVRVMICEDFDKDSPSYGAMCFGSMGFMIASERTPDNRDWNWRTFGTGKGFFADLIVAGTMLADRIRGGILESLDGSIQLDLTNTSQGIQFKKNGKKAIDILGRIIKFYDWDGLGNSIGELFSSRLDGDENVPGIVLANKLNSYLALGYENDGKVYSYVRLDKDKIGPTTKAPITVYLETDFKGNQLWFGHEINSIYKAVSDNLVVNVKNGFAVVDRESGNHIALFRKGRSYFSDDNMMHFDTTPEYFVFYKNGQAYFFKDAVSEAIWSMYDFKCDRKVHVNGDLTVVGNKNCVQKTENYGDRLFYCVEDCESYLTDRSMELFTVEKVVTDGIVTYERVILLDNIFKEAVRTDMDYTIEIFKQGWGDYRIKEQTKDYFIVESDRYDFTFKYVVTAKKRHFEDERLKEFFKPENHTDLENISNKTIEELGEVVCEHEDN